MATLCKQCKRFRFSWRVGANGICNQCKGGNRVKKKTWRAKRVKKAPRAQKIRSR